MAKGNNTRQRALKELVLVDNDTEKFCCRICQKLYLRRGTAENHVVSEHPGPLYKTERLIDEARQEARAESIHKMAFSLVSGAIEVCKDTLSKLKAELNESNVRHFFIWSAEELVLEDVRLELLLQIEQFVDHGSTVDEILNNLKELKESWLRDVVERFPHHNSTSELSNIYDRLEAEAKAKIVSQSWMAGTLSRAIEYFEELKAAVDGNSA